MAYPTIVSSTTATGASGKTFNALTNFACTPGDWIVVMVGYDQAATFTTSSAGWSIIKQSTDNNFYAGALLAKQATGTSENLVITSAGSFTSAWSARIFRISGAYRLVASEPVQLSNTQPTVDPAPVSFPYAGDNLYFCALVADGAATASTPPSGYSAVEKVASAGGITTCYRTTTSSTEDAGVWPGSNNFTKSSFTFGLTGTAPPPPPPRKPIRYSFSF